jgi:Acyl-CoA thioester hydrolase/BAAT N-terminal region
VCEPRFEISPLRGMVDVPLKTRLTGMQPVDLVTVRSSIAGGIWTAEASFEVGADGVIDLEQQAPWETSTPTTLGMPLAIPGGAKNRRASRVATRFRRAVGRSNLAT